MAEKLRHLVQREVKHISCKLPSAIMVYRNDRLNIIGYAATIHADSVPCVTVARIYVFKDQPIWIAYTDEGMVAQDAHVHDYLKQAYECVIARSFAVR